MSTKSNKNLIDTVQSLTGLSLDKIAEIMGVSRQTVAKYKDKTDSITVSQIMKISQATGIAIESLLGNNEMHTGPSISPTYESGVKNLREAIDKAKKERDRLANLRIPDGLENVCHKGECLQELEENIRFAEMSSRKPTICAYGPSDAGKSTIANYLMSQEVLPAGYAPLTSVPAYIHHISEKPDYLEAGPTNAVVFGRHNASEPKFDHENLYDSDKSNPYIIKQGLHTSILKEFGTREGEYFKQEGIIIDEINIFIDNVALKEFTFIDMPGFGSDESSDDVGLTWDAGAFDIVLYLSQADSFLRGEELPILNSIISRKEELDGIYIIASHAKIMNNPKEIQEVLQKGCKRLIKVRANKEIGPSAQELMSRCFGFDISIDYYCEKLNDDFEKTITKMVKRRIDLAVQAMKNMCEVTARKYLNLRNNIREYRENSSLDEDEIENLIMTSHKELCAIQDSLNRDIDGERKNGIEQIKLEYSKIISEENIVNTIEENDFKNRKSDMEDLSTLINNQLDDAIQSSLKKRGEEFSKQVEQKLKDYENKINEANVKMSIKESFDGFDYTRAFAAGLSGLATYGALSVWAAIVAGGSNLGAYILVAKVASVLTGLGFSFGGAAAATTAVSALGGPVVLGIALAVLGAVTVFGILSGNWKSRLAKKMVKVYNEKGVLESCIKNIENYWEETKVAVESCINSLDTNVKDRYKKEFETLKLKVEDLRRVSVVDEMVYDQFYNAYEEMLKEIKNN